MGCKAHGEAKHRSNLDGCEDFGKTCNAADRFFLNFACKVSEKPDYIFGIKKLLNI